MISKYHKENFKILQRAFKNGDVALLECQNRENGDVVAVICAVGRDNEEYVFSPFASLFNDNPYETLSPPDPDGGFIND